MTRGPGMESSHHTVTILEADALDIMKEEQVTPTDSNTYVATKPTEEECTNDVKCNNCTCKKNYEATDRITPEDVEKILKEREAILRAEYDKRFEEETVFLKDRFGFILSNEQMRASLMLREAHRERQEKITALQTQLECKNLAGLMYVMCSERRRSKLERLRLIEEYTNYIRALQDILMDGQALILHLSRGYKTAARVDHEWREKMKKVVREFMSFIYHYTGGTPESNQYFFDLPQLLRTRAPIVDNPEENPCECDEVGGESLDTESDDGDPTWWERIEGDSRPFVMFGDMSEFKPNQRREVLKAVKAAKTAPKKWKEYVFNEMFLKADCSNADKIKDVESMRMQCRSATSYDADPLRTTPRESFGDTNRSDNRQSVDIRGTMGSLLKIITSTNTTQQAPKTTLLGARDSMEIQSTTKLRDKILKSNEESSSRVVISVGKKRSAAFKDDEMESEKFKINGEEEVSVESKSLLGSMLNDSLDVLPNLASDRKDRINYERVCPVDKCKRMQVDSFIRSLPPYMSANPYTHFAQTFEEYETCTPEQLALLKQRTEAKMLKDSPHEPAVCHLDEWTPSVQGVTTQTSDRSVDLPPCTCSQPSPDAAATGMVFNVEDLVPIKQALECIQKACFFDNSIEFDRFKVIGQRTSDEYVNKSAKADFKQKRYYEIKKILKQHPSLLDIFQANTQC